jgi:CheY-like chemotaxis protein/signal transduction histidine kinase/CHASE3 domain sensor protein
MTLNNKILLGFAACVVILVSVVMFAFRNNQKFADSGVWVEHTHEVISEFEQILGLSVDAETGVRGFVIAGEEKFLEPFRNANVQLFEHIDKVQELTVDNPDQQKNIEALNEQLRAHIGYLNRLIETRKTDPDKAFQIVASGEGKQMTDAIRKKVADAQGVEKNLLEERQKANAADARNFTIVFILLILVIVIVLIAVYIIIRLNLRALKRAEIETENKNWLLTGNDELNITIQGDKEVKVLATDMISMIATYLKAQIGAIYLLDDEHLRLVGAYAFDQSATAGSKKIGEGIVGQAALDKKPLLLNDIPSDYIKVNSGLGETKPKALIAFPFTHSGAIKGVIEIASMHPFRDLDLKFLNLVSENIGIAFNSSESRTRLVELLEETQVQSEELQSQQEELRQVNEELEEQSQNLKQQQEELQMTNEELEEQTQTLEAKNREVEAARNDIEQKTKQLEISSRYKSEFLANMSHELRTPLNSLLILSKDLSENKKNNLNADQVESAEIIYRSGHELLNLINEVLDLSKIEAGKMVVNIERVALQSFADHLLRDFRHQADKKSLKLSATLAPDLPQSIRTDEQRLNQIMKNLLSNALKFTEKGGVSISIQRYHTDRIAISVTDTGIGVPEDKQLAIFEAFQQADGGTSRKYGGTGLGLSISRELARLLQAEIKLSSKVGQGSVFTVILPLELKRTTDSSLPPPRHEQAPPPQSSPLHSGFVNYPALPDDRELIKPEDKIVLVIEDDLQFAGILLKLARDKGFRCLSAATGEDGVLLARRFMPSAILLDIDLPGMSGHHVLSELKNDPSVRHIPVHIVSVNERSIEPIKAGAIEYLVKPVAKKDLEEAFNRIEGFVSRKMKNLLIVEDDANSRKAMRKLIGNGDVKCFEAATGEEALNLYETHHIDCIVLDIGLPDINGFELIYRLERIAERAVPPIIIYTGKELSREENEELHKYAESIIIKGVRSEERLLDETALFLHRTIGNLPESKRNIISSLYDKEAVFNGKKILLVDDDMRNIFALSKILKERGMNVLKAENGKAALDVLSTQSGIELVLMDIMMPEMDGYEAMQHIRAQPQFRNLPVIALTAKAMKEDKQKCIDAGASDYITKPVDVERLLTLMRVWLGR